MAAVGHMPHSKAIGERTEGRHQEKRGGFYLSPYMHVLDIRVLLIPVVIGGSSGIRPKIKLAPNNHEAPLPLLFLIAQTLNSNELRALVS